MPRERPFVHRLLTGTALAGAVLAGGAVAACGETDAWHRIVRRLDAPALADRDAAERDLLHAGVAALETVVAARATAAGEAAFRLEWIQRALERRGAAAAMDPAVVTFTATDRPAADVLAAVFARTGNEIALAPDVATGDAATRPVTVAFERATFWEAVDAVLDRGGLALDCGSPGPPGPRARPALEIAAAHGGRLPAVATGPLRVAVNAVEPVGGAAGPRGARIVLRCACEPRLTPLMIRLPARSVVAEGPAGEAMPVAQRAAVVEAAWPTGRPWVDLPVQLAPGAGPLETLGLLRGTLELWLAGLDHTFRFAVDGAAATLSPTALRVAAADVRLLECSAVGGRLSVRAAVTYDTPSEALASHHPWLAARGLAAVLTDGRPLERVDQRVESRSDRGMVAAAAFLVPAGDDGRPREVEIRWLLPVAIHQVPIDFALVGVPLPAAERP